MRSIASLFIVFQLVSLFGGCNNSDLRSTEGNRRSDSKIKLSGIAVVDLDEVAKQLGMDVLLAKQIKNAETSLNKQLGSLQKSLQTQFQQKKQELARQPIARGVNSEDASSKKELAEFERKLNLQLLQSQRKARKEFNTYRQQLIQRFRYEVVPVAQEIAAERGLGVVITKNDAVLLAYDEAHDITAKLIERMREKHSTVPDQQQASRTGHPNPQATQLR